MEEEVKRENEGEIKRKQKNAIHREEKSKRMTLLQTRSRARWPPARTSTPMRAWAT